jgi:hypothetical protein
MGIGKKSTKATTTASASPGAEELNLLSTQELQQARAAAQALSARRSKPHRRAPGAGR